MSPESWRGIFATIAIAGSSLLTGFVAYGMTDWKLPPRSQRGRDLPAAFDARLGPITKLVPPDVEVVGYWSDDPDTGNRQVAHYALAPLLVDEAFPPEREWVVVDARKGARKIPFQGYGVVRNLGSGVALLRRVPGAPTGLAPADPVETAPTPEPPPPGSAK